MDAPTVDPQERQDVPPATYYRQGQPVWVWRHEAWQPGVVSGTGQLAVLVDYHRAGERGHGTVTDTVMPLYVMPQEPEPPRAEPDP